DQAAADRVPHPRKDDRDDRCRLLCRNDGRSSLRDYDIDFQPDKLGRDLGRALVAALRPTILDRDSAPLDPPEFAQPLHETGNPLAGGRKRARAPEPDGRQFRLLLRARCERPCHRRAAEQRDELAPPHHSITSSARASSAQNSVQFRLAATLAMPALAQASSFSPPGAPETPTAPITSLPTLIGTPPPTATTFGICFRKAFSGLSVRFLNSSEVWPRVRAV